MAEVAVDSGFADPVLDAQSAFRAIMEALANPGTVRPMRVPAIAAGRHAGLFAVALTLVDHDTPVWLGSFWRENAALRHALAFHTGARIVEDPSRADFAFAETARELPAIGDFAAGTDEYPDRSTTIVLAVPALEQGPRLVAAGLGIRDRLAIAPAGLPDDFVTQWAGNRTLFPRGVDLLLVTDGAVMGLPRTTRLTPEH